MWKFLQICIKKKPLVDTKGFFYPKKITINRAVYGISPQYAHTFKDLFNLYSAKL